MKPDWILVLKRGSQNLLKPCSSASFGRNDPVLILAPLGRAHVCWGVKSLKSFSREFFSSLGRRYMLLIRRDDGTSCFSSSPTCANTNYCTLSSLSLSLSLRGWASAIGRTFLWLMVTGDVWGEDMVVESCGIIRSSRRFVIVSVCLVDRNWVALHISWRNDDMRSHSQNYAWCYGKGRLSCVPFQSHTLARVNVFV